VSAFNGHALIMGDAGSLGRCSSARTARRRCATFTVLRECPGLRLFGGMTARMEKERDEFYALWLDGKKASALAVAEKSDFRPVQADGRLILNRSPQVAAAKVFLEWPRRDRRWQPGRTQLEMLSSWARVWHGGHDSRA